MSIPQNYRKSMWTFSFALGKVVGSFDKDLLKHCPLKGIAVGTFGWKAAGVQSTTLSCPGTGREPTTSPPSCKINDIISLQNLILTIIYKYNCPPYIKSPKKH